MPFRALAYGFLLGLCLSQIANAGKNCDAPNVRLNVQTVALQDSVVSNEEVVSINSGITSTITRPIETITTSRFEYTTVTELLIDAGCVVSSGSSIYTLTTQTGVIQGTTPISIWVSCCPSEGLRMALE